MSLAVTASRLGRSRRGNELATLLLYGAAVLVTFALAAVVSFVVLPALRSFGAHRGALAGLEWNPVAGRFGLLPLLVGSTVSSLLALAIAVPLALAVAATLSELASDRVRKVSRSLLGLFASIPSVVFGWLGLTFVVPWIARLTQSTGLGLFAAALVLGVVALPTICLLSLDALRALPPGLRESAFALGATRVETLRTVVFPAARSGLATAVLLGLGRALGEAIAVQMVIGNAPIIPRGLFAPSATFATVLVTEMGRVRPGTPHADALFAVALALLVMAMVLLALLRFAGDRGRRSPRGAE